MTPERCAGGLTVGYAHSHPGAGSNWEYPSGFGSQAEYEDSDLNANTTPNTSDLKIADYYFNNPQVSYVGSQGPHVMWYVTSMQIPQTFVKYKKTAVVNAKDNIWKYDYTRGQWLHVSPPW